MYDRLIDQSINPLVIDNENDDIDHCAHTMTNLLVSYVN